MLVTFNTVNRVSQNDAFHHVFNNLKEDCTISVCYAKFCLDNANLPPNLYQQYIFLVSKSGIIV